MSRIQRKIKEKLKFSLIAYADFTDKRNGVHFGETSLGTQKTVNEAKLLIMPNFANNNKPTFLISVRFALFSCVTLLLFVGTVNVGIGDVSSPTGRISSLDKDDTNGKRQTSLFPADGKFLASLRFWEKNQSPPQKEAQQPRPAVVAHAHTPQVPGTPPSDTILTPVGQLEAPLPQYSTIDSAPEPPPSPRFEQGRGTLGDAPLPRLPANAADNGNGLTPFGMPLGTASYVSYAFDTRDWVESFPTRQEQDTAFEGVQMVTQKTALRFPEQNTQQPPVWENENVNWNGHATEIVTHIPQEPRQTAGISASVPSVEKPLIDLSPTYQKRLPHVQTCGVVVVQANFPLTEIAMILEEIHQLQCDLYRYIGVPEPKEKIELCLFKDEDSYSRFLREFFPKAPTDRRALYIKLENKPGTLLVQKSKDFEIDLRHEMTHAIIHASIPEVPIWLDEGLAKYFEVPPKDRWRNNPYMVRVRSDARFGIVPSLDRLVRLETIDDMSAKEYRDSWAWTHFLIRRSPETHQLLAAYLQMLATWSPQDEENTGSILERFTGTQKRSSIPSLKLYLDDIVSNQREAFKEHFTSGEK